MQITYNQKAKYLLVFTITLFSNPDLTQDYLQWRKFHLNIAKGYFLSRGSIKKGEGLKSYLKALNDQLPTVNGEFFARDLATIKKESNLGHLTGIIEFPQKEDEVNAYLIREI